MQGPRKDTSHHMMEDGPPQEGRAGTNKFMEQFSSKRGGSTDDMETLLLPSAVPHAATTTTTTTTSSPSKLSITPEPYIRRPSPARLHMPTTTTTEPLFIASTKPKPYVQPRTVSFSPPVPLASSPSSNNHYHQHHHHHHHNHTAPIPDSSYTANEQSIHAVTTPLPSWSSSSSLPTSSSSSAYTSSASTPKNPSSSSPSSVSASSVSSALSGTSLNGKKLGRSSPSPSSRKTSLPHPAPPIPKMAEMKDDVMLEVRGESNPTRKTARNQIQNMDNGGGSSGPPPITTTHSAAQQSVQDMLEDRVSVDIFAVAVERMPADHRMEAVRELAIQLKRAITLLTFSSSVSTQLDLDKGAETVSEQICDILQADRASLYLLDNDKGELCSKSSRWTDKGAQGTPEIRIPISSGIAGHVATTGATLNIDDAYKSPLFFPEVDRHTGYRTKSILCMPVTDSVTGQVVAVVEALNKRRRKEKGVRGERYAAEAFDAEDIQVMKTLVHHAGTYLRNAQLYKESQVSRNKVRVLLEVASQLASELDTTTLITVIMTKSRLLLDADRCTLFMLDAAQNELWSKVADGTREIRVPANKGIAGHVVTTGEVLNIRDAYLDSRFNPDIDRKTGYRTKTILCMPLRNNKGEIIGVTQMINKKDGVFTIQDEQLLQAFSAQAAVALENSKLFQRTLEMRNYLQSVLQSITNLVLTLDLDGRLASANRPVDIFGVSEERMMKEVYSQWLGTQNELLSNAIAQVYRDPAHPVEKTDTEFVVNGSSIHISFSVVPLMVTEVKASNAGAFQGVVIIIEDVTSQKRMMSTLNRYMSPALAAEVVKNGGDRLGGVKCTVTTLFSDIRNFTAMSERMDALEVVKMLNEYFDHMVGVVFDEGGVLDKYIGDAMMAVFGVPFSKEDDPIRACRAALEMLRRLKKFNAKRVSRGEDEVSIGIGINTGKVLSGNIGSEKRLEYTVIGDGVNLASRMEGVTKQYGAQVLLTEFTNQEVATRFMTRELDSIRVVGKQHPVRIYELLGEVSNPKEFFPLTMAAIPAYREGLDAYREGMFTRARTCFQTSYEASQHTDKPSMLFLARCDALIKEPPTGHWDGVFDMASK
eukprot:TRINITY_DN5359_c0_g1_i6.p1 TRINITY_DN5359_c0_g1~~TRINITY_DN5359_c0_g1_i6.p1  ORF type:complete len:1099 (+),score=288.25 TRINITY_DN5359_c0_g1_i6:56-3352(+)